ncbi:MAG TPA: hypothetical protein VIO64_07850 [Pseudobacteroides sp.]|uniref:hypothetical protein n=1 Tax=Pseudobacteroides sp. TaxID=1968840 RepID=UPI002F93E26B
MKKPDRACKRIACFIATIYSVFLLISNMAYADVAGGGVFLTGTVLIFFIIPIVIVTVICFMIIRMIRNKSKDKNDGL